MACLYMSTLGHQGSVKEIEDTLNGISEDYHDGLDTTYEACVDIIPKISRSSKKWAMKLLARIMFSRRNLSREELELAITIDEGDSEYNKDKKTNYYQIADSTAGLVNLEQDGASIHITFREYPERTSKTWFPDGERDTAMTVLTFMSFDEVVRQIETESDAEAAYGEWPLLFYASQYWSHHAMAFKFDQAFAALLLKLLCDEKRMQMFLKVQFYNDVEAEIKPDIVNGLSALHIAAYYSFDFIIPKLAQENEISVDIVDPRFWETPPMLACRSGRLETVQKLLELEAPVNVLSARETTAFYETYKGTSPENFDIMQLLMSLSGLNINQQIAPEHGRTMLMLACLLDK